MSVIQNSFSDLVNLFLKFCSVAFIEHMKFFINNRLQVSLISLKLSRLLFLLIASLCFCITVYDFKLLFRYCFQSLNVFSPLLICYCVLFDNSYSFFLHFLYFYFYFYASRTLFIVILEKFLLEYVSFIVETWWLRNK